MGHKVRTRRPGAALAELAASFGTTRYAAALDRYRELGAAGLVELLEATAGRVHTSWAKDAHQRDILDDRGAAITALGKAHTGALIEALARLPEFDDSFAIAGALARIDDPRTTGLLVDRLDSRDGDVRWLAVRELTCRCEPALIARLAELLDDRNDSVRFAAVEAARRFGTVADLERLGAIATSEHENLGTCELAFDAIESICARAGAPLPPLHPGPRLIAVEVDADIGAGDHIRVMSSQLVKAKELLCRVGDRELFAPERAVVVGFDWSHDRLIRIVLGRRPA